MSTIDTIYTVAARCAAMLIEQGWEGGGRAYDIGTYHGDDEALADALGRPTTREERVVLETQIRRALDAAIVEAA